jgi:hypothetical protein
MPDYRCDVLDSQDHIIFQADIVAEGIGYAVRHAWRILRDDQQHNPTSRSANVEVWQRGIRVFPPMERLTPPRRTRRTWEADWFYDL